MEQPPGFRLSRDAVHAQRRYCRFCRDLCGRRELYGITEKIQVLKERYKYFAERDLDRTLDLWTDDFIWDGDDAGLPGSGRHEGKQASIAVLVEAASALDRLDLDPQEFFENGDTAVVVGYQDIAKDGRSARVPFVHIWRFRGNQICGVRLVLDTLTTAKVFGTT